MLVVPQVPNFASQVDQNAADLELFGSLSTTSGMLGLFTLGVLAHEWLLGEFSATKRYKSATNEDFEEARNAKSPLFEGSNNGPKFRAEMTGFEPAEQFDPFT